MAGRMTTILMVLGILQYALRLDVLAVQATEEVPRQPEEQRSEVTWLVKAGKITTVLVFVGFLQYSARTDFLSVKVTEEVLRQQEEQRSQEMAKLQEMEQMKEEPPGPMQGNALHLACHELWFWLTAEILLVLFAIFWLPRQNRAGCDREASTSAQEQTEEEEERGDWEDDPNPYDKPLDKSWALWRIFWRRSPAAMETSNQKKCSPTSTPN